MQKPTSSQPAQVGQTIGSYELIEKIDEAASLIVFRGRDSLLDRQVVIKQVLLSVEISDNTRERIEHCRKLSHQHKRIVNLIELIDDVRGVFIVSEYIAGESLDTWLARNKPIKPMSALRIVRSTALALEILHQEGLIHRDLRPGNMIVTAAGTVQIADLGLADLVAEQEALGLESVRYMPPELCRGEAGDPRSDLYSLGLVAYEMLVGRTAFENTFKVVLRDTRQQAMRWMKWHTNLRIALPPACKLNEQIPPILSELIGRLIEKDPVKRIESARQLIDAIERNFDTSQTKTSSQTPSSPARKISPSSASDTAILPKRSRKPVILASILGVLLLGGAAWFTVNTLARQRTRQQYLQDARTTLDQAQQLYKTGQFAQAMTSYRQVASQFDSGTRFGEVAAAGKLLCEARLQMDETDYTTARKTLEQVEAAGVFGRDTLRALFDEVDHRLAMTQATEQIRQQIETGQFDLARRGLRQWRVLVLLEGERLQLNDLHDQLEGRLMQQRVNQILSQADASIEAGQTEQAIAALTLAQQRLHQPALSNRLDELLVQQQLDALLRQGERAEGIEDYSAAIIHYTHALNLRASNAIIERLSQAKMQAAVKEGRRLFEQDDLNGAEVAFTRALGYSDSDEARGYLARMEVADQKQSLVRAADRAMSVAEFSAAVRHYKSAQQLDPADDALKEKLSNAQVRDFVSQGHREIAQQHYDDARKVLGQALKIDSESDIAREALDGLETLLEYLEHLNAGDKHRRESQFFKAKRSYQKAREVIDDERIRERFEDVEYEHLIVQVRRYIDALQWGAAEARLRSAAKIHNTDTVRQLEEQIRQERDDDS